MPPYWPVSGPQGVPGTPGATGATGAQGVPGNNGTNGAPGSVWFNGTGAPAGGTGIVGDYYLDNASHNYYTKTGVATWTLLGTFTSSGTTGLIAPVDANFSWVNQNGASLLTGGVLLNNAPGSALRGTATNNYNHHLRVRNVPVAPYNVDVGLVPGITPGNYTYLGMCLYDSVSGKIITWGFVWAGGLTFSIDYWTNVTTYNSTPAATALNGIMGAPVVWFFRIADDGVTRSFQFSQDGTFFQTYFTTVSNTFFVPTSIGYYLGTSANTISTSNVVHYLEH